MRRLIRFWYNKQQDLYLGPVEDCRLESDLWGLGVQRNSMRSKKPRQWRRPTQRWGILTLGSKLQ